MDKRGQFTFYRSFWEAVQSLPKKDRLPVLEAIISYALDGEEQVVLTGKQLRAFASVAQDLEKERRASLEGRRSSEYKAWRRAVFEKDDYTCQFCGKRGVKINAHHIKPYAWYPDLRYSISNGTTLCVCCHKLVHRLMRKGLL